MWIRLLTSVAEAEGDNVDPPNNQSPTYNQRMGFMDGAQDDIFASE